MLLFAAGAAAVLAMSLPYLILGLDSIVTYHDQLDGELIAYLLQARHLFRGDTLAEFMGGASKTALVPPAPAAVLLFLGGDGFLGFCAMQLLGSLSGYLGMFLLVERQAGESWIAVIMGVLYAYLPFLPVYGLSQYGLPLLLFFLLEAREGRRRRAALLYAAVFALNSSLVLVGFAVLGVMAVWMLAEFFYPKERKGLRALFWPWLAMLGIYFAENYRLIVQMLGLGAWRGKGWVSHKAQYVLAAENMTEGFFAALLQGGQHSRDYHGTFLWAAAAVAAIAFAYIYICKKGQNAGRPGVLLKTMGTCAGCNVLFALTAALWNGSPGIFLRSRLQALGAFQVERVLWLAPCLWYLCLGCSLAMAKGLWRGKVRMALTAFMAAVLCMTGIRVFLGSSLKPNLGRLMNPGYAAMSFRDYYAIGVLSQVEDFLEESCGLKKEEYRVVSLGIDPAAALYHGFYCLDGYSNNYSLAYKRDFRKAIAPELQKSDYLADYFDAWGNRCYLFSAECPGYYTIEKGGFYFQNYGLNAEALRAMGGKYLFSAAYIANAGEQGLALLREEGFETQDSYYRIFVYEF